MPLRKTQGTSLISKTLSSQTGCFSSFSVSKHLGKAQDGAGARPLPDLGCCIPGTASVCSAHVSLDLEFMIC